MTERGERLVETVVGLDPLADLPRTGWLLRGVRPCESVAEHSFGVVLVTMLLVDALRAEGMVVDGERAMRMAVVHDAPEARTGDVPMPNKTPALREALRVLEADLVERLLPEAPRADWHALEAGESLEARIVKAADKLQMMIKALCYGAQGRGELMDFWSNPRNFEDRGLMIAREAFEALAARAGRTVPR